MDGQQGLGCEFSNVGSMCLRDGMEKVGPSLLLAVEDETATSQDC